LLHAAIAEGRSIGPGWLQQLSARLMQASANLNGVRIASNKGEGLDYDIPGSVIYAWHPHGFVSYVPSHLMGLDALGRRPHGTEWFGTCIPLLFKVPMIGEIFSVTNARPVDSQTVNSILSKGKGISVQPGGVKEQAASRHDQEQAFFPSRLGFVRLAIKYGIPVMPVYFFGENQLYTRVDGFEWFTTMVKKVSGMTMPVITAKWGLPMAGMLPHATDIHVRWGRPVEVGPPEAEPSDERVQEVFQRYVAELQRLWDLHAKDCLPPEVAAKGLKIVLPEKKTEAPTSRL